jgi:hypothetical protein
MCISLASVFCILKIHCLDQSACQHTLSLSTSLCEPVPYRMRALLETGQFFTWGLHSRPHVLHCCIHVLLEIVTFFFRSMEVTTAPRDSYSSVSLFLSSGRSNLCCLTTRNKEFFRPWKLRHELLLRVTFFCLEKLPQETA